MNRNQNLFPMLTKIRIYAYCFYIILLTLFSSFFFSLSRSISRLTGWNKLKEPFSNPLLLDTEKN